MGIFFDGIPYRWTPGRRDARPPARAVFAWRAALASCVALAAVAGCSDPDTLTCAWLASADNCWRNTALTAVSCLPPQTESGTFNADNSTCTYPSGSIVTFAPALVLPPPIGADMKWNIAITDANGQPCVHYQDTGSSLALTVGTQTVSEGSAGGLGISISCPDGKSVRTSNAFNLFDCPDGSLIDLPGLTWSGSSTSMSAGLTGTGDTSVPLFDCNKPVP
jgi:hypothetical protein